MTSRSSRHVRDNPMAGDVIELTSNEIDPATGEAFTHEVMIRVVAVHEERVWYKEYGKGHELASIAKWKERYDKATIRQLIRGADHDAPF